MNRNMRDRRRAEESLQVASPANFAQVRRIFQARERIPFRMKDELETDPATPAMHSSLLRFEATMSRHDGPLHLRILRCGSTN